MGLLKVRLSDKLGVHFEFLALIPVNVKCSEISEGSVGIDHCGSDGPSTSRICAQVKVQSGVTLHLGC